MLNTLSKVDFFCVDRLSLLHEELLHSLHRTISIYVHDDKLMLIASSGSVVSVDSMPLGMHEVKDSSPLLSSSAYRSSDPNGMDTIKIVRICFR